MLSLEEELKNFQPIPETGEVEDLVYQRDLTDMTDIMKAMLNETGKER